MPTPINFDGMMHEYCVGLGFCGGTVVDVPRNVRDRIPKKGNVSVDEFVDWSLWAEGISPADKEYKRWLPELKTVFLKHMKRQSVAADTLFDHVL